jgi:solute carrier family 25 citrate transporter 1
MSSSTSKPFGGGRSGDRVGGAGKSKTKVPLSTHLIAGGAAGLAEALVWWVITGKVDVTRDLLAVSLQSPARHDQSPNAVVQVEKATGRESCSLFFRRKIVAEE